MGECSDRINSVFQRPTIASRFLAATRKAGEARSHCSTIAMLETAVKNRLTYSILAGMILGVIVGYLCHVQAADAASAKTIAGYFSIVTDIFLRLIKMIISPLVFCTLVSGLAGMESASAAGRIGSRTAFNSTPVRLPKNA